MSTEQWIQTGIATACLLVIFFLREKIADLLLKGIFLGLRKSNPAKADRIRPALVKPLGWFLVCGVALILLPVFPFPAVLTDFLRKLLNSLLIIIAFWTLYDTVRHLLDEVESHSSELPSQLTVTARKYLSSAVLVFVIVLGIIMVLEQWLTNLSGLLTSLGIGGLAVALAAQDTASNLVAGLAIMLDKPFDVGDWIETNSSSGKVSGTVTTIGLRSSRVRAIDGSTLTVPNSILGSAVIVNGTKRQIRLADLEIPLRQTSTDVLEKFRGEVLAALAKDPGVIENTASFYFTGYGRDALIWRCRFQTTDDYGQHMEITHRVNLTISRLAEEANISLAPIATDPTSNQK